MALKSYLRYAGHGDIADRMDRDGVASLTAGWILSEMAPKSKLSIGVFVITYFNLIESLM